MKKLASFLLVCTLMLTTAACAANKQAQPPAANSDQAPETSSPAKPVTLKLGIPNGATLTPKEIIDSFKTKNPNITVVADETPWSDFKTKLQTQVAAGNPSDVFFMDSGYTATLGGLGAALDLAPLIKKDLNTNDYSQNLLSAKNSEGKIFGVPHAVQPVAIAYNKTLFDKAGIPYPKADWTYQDMFDIAKKLTKDDVYGLAWNTNITQGWLPFILSTGGAPLDATRTKSMFNDPKTIEGLKKFESAIQELKIIPPNAWLKSNGGGSQAFCAGKIGMIIILPANATTAINKTAPDLNYDVAMMPIGWDGKRNVVFVANHWSIYSKCAPDVQAAAWTWIKHYLSEESQGIYAKTCPAGYPVRKSALDFVAKSEYKPANKAAFIDGMGKYGVSLFENPTWQEWTTETNKIIGDFYDGKIKAEDTAAQIHKTIQPILDSKK